jgi:hypothetical protein
MTERPEPGKWPGKRDRSAVDGPDDGALGHGDLDAIS